MSVKELLEKIKIYLKNINVLEYDMFDLYKIISYSINIEVNQLYILELKLGIDNTNLDCIYNNLKKYYIDKIPLAYIIKKQSFYSEDYFVNENVLIPRYDSEILVEKAIYYIEKFGLKKMLDMCSGSGCLGISISCNSNIKEALLADISEGALEIINKNILYNKIDNKCSVIKSDLFSNISSDNKFDLIVSNPPYIKTDVIKTLDEYVKKEPVLALDGGPDGMMFYEKILNESKKHLNDNSYIIFEIGYDQLEDMKNLVSRYKNYDIIECIKDYSGNDRVVVCRFHQK